MTASAVKSRLINKVKMTYPKRLLVDSKRPMDLRVQVPKIITFDAYNTLYCTKVPVMELYSAGGAKYGVNVDVDTLTARFPDAFRTLNKKYPNYGKAAGWTADEWWQQLIKDVFKPEVASDEMVESILKTFEGKNAYAVYPDILHILTKIKAEYPEIVVGIISNTDPTAYKLMDNLEISHFFEDFMYLSYDLNMCKPNKEIYEYVLSDIVNKRPDLLKNSTINELRTRCWHIGDELKNDLLGAKDAGWNSILVDRLNSNHYFNEIPHKFEITEHKLSLDKISQRAEEVWKLSRDQKDIIQLDKNSFVTSNITLVESLFFTS